MLSQYKHLTDQQRWVEYGRLKSEWIGKNGYGDEKSYDAYIEKITKDLGI